MVSGYATHHTLQLLHLLLDLLLSLALPLLTLNRHGHLPRNVGGRHTPLALPLHFGPAHSTAHRARSIGIAHCNVPPGLTGLGEFLGHAGAATAATTANLLATATTTSGRASSSSTPSGGKATNNPSATAAESAAAAAAAESAAAGRTTETDRNTQVSVEEE